MLPPKKSFIMFLNNNNQQLFIKLKLAYNGLIETIKLEGHSTEDRDQDTRSCLDKLYS